MQVSLFGYSRFDGWKMRVLSRVSVGVPYQVVFVSQKELRFSRTLLGIRNAR
jgi:hypothetical protein